MNTLRRLSAYVRVKKLASGVAVLTYAGPMHNKDFEKLREHALEKSAGAGALVLDMRAVLPLSELAPLTDASTYGDGQNPPGAVISPEPHTATWWRYAAAVARLGIARAVFTSPSEAQAWAQERLPSRRRRS